MFNANAKSYQLVVQSLFTRVQNGICQTQTSGIKFYAPVLPLDKSDWPENRKLRPTDKQPDVGSQKAPRMPKMIQRMRGPEPVHVDLLYKGYGVVALLGGRLKHEHFEFIRNVINKKLDTNRMFALWRVDNPWQPCSKRSTGKRMGGGKGSIHHYVTPVKANRVIVEIGGDLQEVEARSILSPLADSMPFPARVYSQKELDEEKRQEEWREKNNLNPFTMEYVIKNNIGGCQRWLGKYDYEWFGKYK